MKTLSTQSLVQNIEKLLVVIYYYFSQYGKKACCLLDVKALKILHNASIVNVLSYKQVLAKHKSFIM